MYVDVSFVQRGSEESDDGVVLYRVSRGGIETGRERREGREIGRNSSPIGPFGFQEVGG